MVNWNNLKQNKCPKCNHFLKETHNGVQNGYGCSQHYKICNFFIGKEKFNEIVGEEDDTCSRLEKGENLDD